MERCRTDASILIVTYTSSHNHPGPDLSTTPNTLQNQTKEPQKQPIEEETPTTPKEEQQQEMEEEEEEEEQQQQEQQEQQPIIAMAMASDEDASTKDQFHYFKSSINHEEEDPFKVNLEKTHDDSLSGGHVIFDEEPLAYPHLMTFSSSTPKSEENDFFDELEELPTSSSFTSFMRSGSFNFFDDRILVLPSWSSSNYLFFFLLFGVAAASGKMYSICEYV